MPYQIQLLETQHSFTVDDNESILEGAFRAKVKMPHECQFGGCGTCRVKLVSGSVNYDEFPMGLTPEESQQGYALACQAKPASDLVLSIASRTGVFSDPVDVDARVVSIKPLTSDITCLTLSLCTDGSLSFQPGQYANLVLEDGSTRSFSMASSNAGGTVVDFYIRRITGGYFTGHLLNQLHVGAALKLQFPLGSFCYHAQDGRELIMVATGTGIAPVKAILESLLDSDDCPPVSLYWGMRTPDELYLRNVFESWKPRLYEFNFVPVLSRGGPGWQGRQGHVQHAVAHDFTDLSEHAVYLCGSPNMIAQAKSLFVTRGANLDYIYSDSFMFQHQAQLAT